MLTNLQTVPTNVTTWEWVFESQEHSPLHALSREFPLGRYENAITKEKLDYAEVKDVATKLSTALVHKYGFETGDTISILASNTVWYPVALWAAVRAGGRVNGASPGYNVEEMTCELVHRQISSSLLRCHSLGRHTRRQASISSRRQHETLADIRMRIHRCIEDCKDQVPVHAAWIAQRGSGCCKECRHVFRSCIPTRR